MVSRSNDPNNKCTFKSFPCEDFESWKNGKCFNCNDPGCPVPGPDMDYGTPYKGRYYFGTLPNTDEEFCGNVKSYGTSAINTIRYLFIARQYVVTLSPDVKVSGQISLILRGPPGETNSIKFQGYNDGLFLVFVTVIRYLILIQRRQYDRGRSDEN